MYRKLTSSTLDHTINERIGCKLPSKDPASEEEGEAIFNYCLSDYIKISAQDVVGKDRRFNILNPFFLVDYFKDPALVELMGKYKTLCTRKNALFKKQIAPVAIQDEIEFAKNLESSYFSVFLHKADKKLKRAKSASDLRPSQKIVMKKAIPFDVLPAPSCSSKGGLISSRRPQRYNLLNRNKNQTQPVGLGGIAELERAANSLRKELTASRKGSEFTGNFIDLSKLLDFIFLKEDDPDSMELDFNVIEKLKRVLLICYEVIISPVKLLSEIIKRFWILEDKKASSSETEMVIMATADQVSLLNFIKTWIREKPQDFQHDENLMKNLRNLLVTISLKFTTSFRPLVRQISYLLDKIDPTGRTEVLHLLHINKKEFRHSQKTRSYLSQMHQELNLLTLHNIQEILMIVPAFEIAKQFCLFDLRLISQIRLHHLRGNQKNKNGLRNAYAQSGHHFNYFSLFLIFLIARIEQKGQLVSRLVCIANSLFELRNFQGFAVIMSALTHTYVSQIVNKSLQEEDRELFSLKHDLEALFDKKNTHRSFKRAINQSVYPMVPFIPVIAQDILRIDAFHTSSQKSLDDSEISINLDKMEQIFQTFENVYLTKFSTYDYEPINIFQDFLNGYYEKVLYAYTQTQDVYEIEEILHDLIKSQ